MINDISNPVFLTLVFFLKFSRYLQHTSSSNTNFCELTQYLRVQQRKYYDISEGISLTLVNVSYWPGHNSLRSPIVHMKNGQNIIIHSIIPTPLFMAWIKLRQQTINHSLSSDVSWFFPFSWKKKFGFSQNSWYLMHFFERSYSDGEVLA